MCRLVYRQFTHVTKYINNQLEIIHVWATVTLLPACNVNVTMSGL